MQKKSAALTKEEREILKNREVLENLELLQNFDKFRYFDLFVENDQNKPKRPAKAAATKEERKEK